MVTPINALGSAIFAVQVTTSLLTDCTFRNHDVTTSVIQAGTTLNWHCPLGNWSPPTGIIPRAGFPPDFTGCPYGCPLGTIGDRHNITDAADCTSCRPGHFCNETGLAVANQCPAGRYMPSSGARSPNACLRCGAGQFNNQTGREECNACAPGSFSAEDGSTACTACPSGGWCPDAGGTSRLVLRECAPGSYNPDEGASTNASCRPCARGTANLMPGQSSPSACVACLPGTVNPLERQQMCTRCASGTYQDVARASSCQSCAPGAWCTASAQVPCGENKWNNESGSHDQQDCRLCPPFSSTLGIQNASSREQCKCDVDQFDNSFITGADQPDCRQCRVGTSCPEKGTTLETLPLSPGFWRASAASLDVRRCPDAAENCASAICDNSSSGCRGGVDSSAYCASSLDGPLCRLCKNVTDRVYYVPADGGRAATCEACDDMVGRNVGIAVAIIVGLVLALLVLRMLACSCPSYAKTLNRYQTAVKPESKLKILVGFCACTTPRSHVCPLQHSSHA